MKFPFPTRPDPRNLKIAIRSLLLLKALDIVKTKGEDEEETNRHLSKMLAMETEVDNTNITDLGKALSYIPITPRFAKMILMSRKEECLEYSMLIAAGLSVEEIFHGDNQSVLESKAIRDYSF